MFCYFCYNFVGGMKHVVAEFDVRDRTLTLYNESFVWEGKKFL